MKLLLRKIHRKRWITKSAPLSKDDLDDLSPDFPLENQRFSVYKIENDEDLYLAILGLASNRTDLNKIEYVLVDVSDVSKEDFKLELEETLGKTPCSEANLRHRNVIITTNSDLNRLIEIVFSKGITDVTQRADVKKMLLDEIATGKYIRVDQLDHGLHKDLKVKCDCKIEQV